MTELDKLLAREREIRSSLYQGDQDPHMWDYWVEDKGFETAIREYYPGTLKYDDEIKTLFYVWVATEEKSLKKRISSIMEERSEAWKEKYGEELGIW